MILLKKVTNKDSRFILSWRNENQTRLYSRNQNIISQNDHKKWFKNEIKNKKNILIIAYQKNTRVGFIRYNYVEKNCYEISINLNPKYRGKGIGSIFLKESEAFLKYNCVITACVKNNNSISKKLFEKNNYIKLNSNKNIIKYIKVHDYKTYNRFKYYEKIIGEIEKVRKNNNVNWMDLLRLAFNSSPSKAKLIFKNILGDDKKINNLSKKLANLK